MLQMRPLFARCTLIIIASLLATWLGSCEPSSGPGSSDSEQQPAAAGVEEKPSIYGPNAVVSGNLGPGLVEEAIGPSAPALPSSRTQASVKPLSLLPLEVDPGSYFYSRGYLAALAKPPYEAVRIEEWVNAFTYDYPEPAAADLFSIALTAGPSPFDANRVLVRIGIKAKEPAENERLPVQLVFLVDATAQMKPRFQLPLIKAGLVRVAESMRPDDAISIVSFGEGITFLPLTMGQHKSRIIAAIQKLRARGDDVLSAEPLQKAYQALSAADTSPAEAARRHPHILLLSGGDARSGAQDQETLLKVVRAHRSAGVRLSTLGFGRANFYYHQLEQLADAGGGRYDYIDRDEKAERILQGALLRRLAPIANKVSVEVEMNPAAVSSYRVIGFNNPLLAHQDFKAQTRAETSVHAGQTTTALYELDLVGGASDILTVRVHAGNPGAKPYKAKATLSPGDVKRKFADLDVDTRWAAAVAVTAAYAQNSAHVRRLRLKTMRSWLQSAAAGPYAAERQDFVELFAGKKLRRPKRHPPRKIETRVDVEIELALLTGKIDAAMLEQVLKRHETDFLVCFGASLRQGNPKDGTVATEFFVSGAGRADPEAMTFVENESGEKKLTMCLRRVFERLRFPRAEGPAAKLRASFVFGAAR